MLANWLPLSAFLSAESYSNSGQTCYHDTTLAFQFPRFQVIAMEILYVTTIAAIVVLCMALLFMARRILRSSPLSSGELALAGIYDGPSVDDTRQDDLRIEGGGKRTAHNYESAVQERLDSVVRRRTVVEHVDSEAIMATWVPSPEALDMTEREMEEIEAEMIEPHGLNPESPAIETSTAEATATDSGYEASAMQAFAAESIAVDNFMSEFALPETPAPAATRQSSTIPTDEVMDEKPVREKRTRVRKPLPAGYTYGLECLLLGVSVLVLVATQRSAFRHRSLESSHRVA